MEDDRLSAAEQALREANPLPPAAEWRVPGEADDRSVFEGIVALPRRRALRRMRRAAVPVVGIVAAGALLLVGIRAADEPRRVPDGGAQTPLTPEFSVFERSDAPFDPGRFARAMELQPRSGRLAYTDPSGTYAVGRNASGDACLIFIGSGQGAAFKACEPWESLSVSGIVHHVDGESVEARTIGLVPDGVTSVALPDGRIAPVQNNVFSVTNGGIPPATVTLRGPSGETTVRVGPP